METIYSIDLKRVAKEKAVIPIMDRGFLYGDSIYEVVRTYKGKLFHLERHFRRLTVSANRLSLPVPFNMHELGEHLKELIKGVSCDCYIRIIITRGEDSVFDLFPNQRCKPHTTIAIREIQHYPEEFFTKGIKLAVVSVMRNPKTSLDPEIKSGNYLNNILAIMEAKAKGADDALMVNENGYITESTTSNLFLVREGRVLTPKFEAGILHGITRELLIEAMAREKMEFEEKDLTPKDVYGADECFVTATTKEVMPATVCDGKQIKDGKVGPVTKRSMKLYRQEVVRVIGG